MKHFNCKCALIDNCSISITDSLMNIYLEYWNGCTRVENDNELEYDWNFINTNVVMDGLVCVVKGYSLKYTIPKIDKFWVNKNNRILLAKCIIEVSGDKIIYKDNSKKRPEKVVSNKVIYVLNYEFSNDRNFILDAYKDIIPSEMDLYEGVFIKNNAEFKSSCNVLDPVLNKIRDIEVVARSNRELMRSQFLVSAGHNLTREQVDQFQIEISSDGRIISGIMETKDNNNNYSKITIGLIPYKPNPTDWREELKTWIEIFYDYAGIRKERLSYERENRLETKDRTYSMSIRDNNYYVERERFIRNYNKLFGKNAVLMFGSEVMKERENSSGVSDKYQNDKEMLGKEYLKNGE